MIAVTFPENLVVLHNIVAKGGGSRVSGEALPHHLVIFAVGSRSKMIEISLDLRYQFRTWSRCKFE